MCEAGVTNAEPSEDNSISAVKVGEVAIAKRQNVHPLSLPESLTMDSQIMVEISGRALHRI